MGYPENLERYRLRVEEALEVFLSRCGGPKELLDAMAYSLLGGGKRMRPMLLLTTRAVFPEGGLDPMPAACALEFIHTYSLIHDDLPAMDNDDMRRGKPSSHKQFGEAMAILAGDALLTQAFWLMAEAYRGDLTGLWVIEEVARAAGSAGMVGGQVLDTVLTGQDVDQAGLEQIHALKTGALILAAVRCGAILGKAGDEDLAALTRAAQLLGLAFQVSDDVLDATASPEELGKTPGKDAASGKNTYVRLMGVEKARRYARRLADEAMAHLERFGERARDLRTLALLLVERRS